MVAADDAACTQMNHDARAGRAGRAIMEAVAVLHDRGYGRLKLFCYVKEGLGAWRHQLFAGDRFPPQGAPLPRPVAGGSLPSWPVARGATAEQVADAVLAAHPGLAAAAVGADDAYVAWYREMLVAHPVGALEMESGTEACISGVELHPPGP